MPKTKPSVPPYVYVTYIHTTPQKLWRALTDPAFISQYWMGRDNASTWKRGAALESRGPDGELEWHGKIIESKPPRRLVYTFQGTGKKDLETHVTFDVAPLGKATPPYRGDAVKLTVTHQGYAPGSRDLKGISTGWPAILSGLKSLLETGRALRIRYVG